jgi:cytochrome c553
VSRAATLAAATFCAAIIASAAATPPAVQDLVARAMQATPDAQHGRILYLKRCRSCHGPRGWGNGLKEVPTIAGQQERYLLVQLAEFALLERNGSAMHRATSPSDVGHAQAIRDLAAFLSQAPANPQSEQGDGRALATGEKLFQRQCATCHGKAAEGSSDEPIPALAGQHFAYTLLQLKSFATGHRGQVEPPVIDFTAGLSEQDRAGIADYLSRLPSKH